MSTQAQQPGALGLIAARWPRLTAGASAGGAGLKKPSKMQDIIIKRKMIEK